MGCGPSYHGNNLLAYCPTWQVPLEGLSLALLKLALQQKAPPELPFMDRPITGGRSKFPHFAPFARVKHHRRCLVCSKVHSRYKRA